MTPSFREHLQIATTRTTQAYHCAVQKIRHANSLSNFTKQMTAAHASFILEAR